MRIGLALGGGGVRGIAHIPVLEAFDAAGVVPAAIAGTSMGAILGALYAAGRTGRAIRRRVLNRTLPNREAWRRFLRNRAALAGWLRAIRPDFRRGGVLRTDRVISLLAHDLHCETFEELRIPLRVIAADFWSGEEVVLDRGPLLSAIQASMAVPGVFSPIERDGRVLVDGGLVNLVPWNVLRDVCDRVIAVHVAAPAPRCNVHRVPNLAEAVLGAFDIGHAALLAERLRTSPPDLWVAVPLRDIGIFEFTRIAEVLQRGEAAATQVQRALSEWVS